jgi:hypothetical protein
MSGILLNTQADFVLNDEVDHCNLDDVHYEYDNILPRKNLDHKRTKNYFYEYCEKWNYR